MKSRIIRLLLAVMVLAMSACGPVVPTELAMRQVQIDVKYGAQHSATPAPTPGNVFTPPSLNFATPEFVPLPPAPVASPPPPLCPALSAFAVPKEPATPVITGAPPKGMYVMRSSGTYSLASTKGALPTSVFLVQPNDPVTGSDQVDGTFADYSLVEAQDQATYWGFDFRLAPGNTATPGILITAMHWRDKVRGNLDFFPEQPVQFLPTPVSIGNTWTAVGTDPIDQTSMTLQGSIPAKTTVDACGTALDSFDVHISGNIVSPTAQLTWTADYDIGTQFGGLTLAEHVTLSGPDSGQSPGDTYTYDATSTINSTPPAPQP